MSPQPDQNESRSVLSWESVLDASDNDSTANPPITSEPASPSPPPSPPPTSLDAPDNLSAGSAPVANDIELTIAPLSLDPLSLDPLPPIPESPARPTGSGAESNGVIGDLHLVLPPLELTDSPPRSAATPPRPPTNTPPPTPTNTPPPPIDESDLPVFEMLDLKIAPLDVPNGPLRGELTAELAGDEETARPSPAPEPSQHTPAQEPAPAPAPAPAASAPWTPAQLPNDPVVADATPTTPTTVITAVADGQAALPAVPGADTAADSIAEAPVASVPTLLPNQISQAAAGSIVAPAARAKSAATDSKVSRKDRKHDEKLKKHQQKHALQAAKVKGNQHSSGGGVALFFTLLVLAGLIAGAIVFGKPYLFPDQWDDASRPYGEAVEGARGVQIDEPLVVQRRAADVFAVSMAEHVIGPWEEDMATWRSLGLVSGDVDAELLGDLVPDWTTAYYSPATGEVIANDATPAAALDAAVTEAMAAAAVDQESGWSSSIDESLLDAAALTRASVTASSRLSAAATSFGAADVSIREIAVSTFLPPVLEYRVNAADAYAEFAPDNAAALVAVAASSELGASTEPQVLDGETLVEAQQATDRTFWYLVFASYVDAPTAYAASNALVQASLATSDAAGTQCTYGTFSGTDVAGTSQVAAVLQQWAATTPSGMNSSFTTLPNGSMQLRSCDPGVGAASEARFGIGREIARFRSVELAAITGLVAPGEATIDRAAVIEEVRASAIGLEMLDVPYDAAPDASADRARAVVAAATLTSRTPAGE